MICVVIPNYNGLENLKTLYPSLLFQTYKDFKIVLVDNGSEDSSIEYTKSILPGSEIVSLKKNFGFAKAINEGIKYSLKNFTPEYILLLNNDIELTEDFLEKGNQTLTDVPEASFLAVKMLNFYNRNVIDDTGNFIKIRGGSPYVRAHAEADTGQYDNKEFIFGACAGAAFYRSWLFTKVGLFDEDFFAYLEDVDLSFRFQLAGYKCYYNPEIVCYHKRGDTVKKFKIWETYYSEKNLVALRLKNYPLITYIKYSPLFFIARIRRYYKFFMHYPKGVFKYAVKGYLKGLTEIPKSIKKRRNIQKSRVVTVKYIEKLFL
jgi:GT2 family glycosyltransferase